VFSETSAHICQYTWRHILEHGGAELPSLEAPHMNYMTLSSFMSFDGAQLLQFMQLLQLTV